MWTRSWVRGDIAPEELGVCDAHNHLFLRAATLPDQKLGDAEAGLAEVNAFSALGGVRWRDGRPEGMRRSDLSRARAGGDPPRLGR